MFLKNRKPRLPKKRVQRATPVAHMMMVDRVMVGPENLERRNRQQKRTCGREQRVSVAQCFARLIQVLEDVQHQHERIRHRRTKITVEWSDSDSRAMRALRIDHPFVGFAAIHLAALRKPSEQQTITTSHADSAT